MNNQQEPFSKRHGFGPEPPKIKIWEEAPESFRTALLFAASDTAQLSPSPFREIVCRILRERPDPSNWSEYPNIWGEVEHLVYRCDWFRVYDILEAVAQYLEKRYSPEKDAFENEMNNCLRELGIGWQLQGGVVQSRSEDSQESLLGQTKEALKEAAMPTAESELSEAVKDLSRRPNPDLSGTVHHAMASLECVARQVTGKYNATLGEIIKNTKTLIPKPLDEAVSKAWGYASNEARHGKEDRNLTRAEAQLIVGLSASVAMYLVQKDCLCDQ